MSDKFKVGDVVVEKSTGDAGIISSKHELYTDAYWVRWQTGYDIGTTLWIDEEKIMHKDSISEQDAITLLKNLGYKVFKEV